MIILLLMRSDKSIPGMVLLILIPLYSAIQYPTNGPILFDYVDLTTNHFLMYFVFTIRQAPTDFLYVVQVI